MYYILLLYFAYFYIMQKIFEMSKVKFKFLFTNIYYYCNEITLRILILQNCLLYIINYIKYLNIKNQQARSWPLSQKDYSHNFIEVINNNLKDKFQLLKLRSLRKISICLDKYFILIKVIKSILYSVRCCLMYSL